VLPARRTPAKKPTPPRYFSDAELLELIESQGSAIAGITGEPGRFSLAGAQDKITVTLGKQGYALPGASRPSSHILKFETIKRVCFAEFMANQMAAAIGLPVVETEYRAEYAGSATAPWLQITRYDRAGLDDRLVRLHQEDVLQALGIPDSMKYQKDGGPSLREIAEVLRAHVAAPARSIAERIGGRLAHPRLRPAHPAPAAACAARADAHRDRLSARHAATCAPGRPRGCGAGPDPR
jgi:serine/threonine-protein kinase HipA